MIEYKKRKTFADRIGADAYVWLAKVWVGKMTLKNGAELLSDREHRDMFATLDARTYVKSEVYENVDGTKQVLLMNLLRAHYHPKLCIPAMIQCMLAVMAMNVLGWFLLSIFNIIK